MDDSKADETGRGVAIGTLQYNGDLKLIANRDLWPFNDVYVNTNLLRHG